VLIIQPIGYVTRRKCIGSCRTLSSGGGKGDVPSSSIKKEWKFRTKRARRSSSRQAKNRCRAPSGVEQQQVWVIHVKRFR